MQLYADVDYYRNIFVVPIDELTDDGKIEKLLQKAKQKIDEKTYNCIIDKGFKNLTIFQQEKVKNACCYQVNYYYENGTDEDIDISSYSVLDINVSLRNNQGEASYNCMSKSAYSELKQTGLMNGVL